MKKLYVFLISLISISATGQISSNGTTDGSIIITPKGIQGSSNAGLGRSSMAVGSNALRNNTSAAYDNTAIGDSSLFSNTTGFQNTALGSLTLQNNTTGVTNTAIGNYVLYSNQTGTHNSGTGNLALYANTTGIRNTALGNATLFRSIDKDYSTAVGNFALYYSNAEGNTATGAFALRNVTTGTYNTANGVNAGLSLLTGGSNTFLGYGSDVTTNAISHSVAIGANAKVNASFKVRIGDENISVIEGQVAWSNPSDRRLKESILYTSRLGLDFINGLKTVTYNYISDKNKIRYDGFIAQDIEKLMSELAVPFSGLKRSDDGMLSLAYSDFVMPLVNAIQEQQKEIEALKAELAETNELKYRLEQLEAKLLN
ncbi:tail fiber domain-containing protein [Arcticibacterium luteifluviistationis]|uniref:Peptidase S74 domain-containing protein n=1 Tax=Arcticibacterium luteifluviistationis TaxID=1784714 RepID=A0A2Z4GGZ1_9BACT|nr:tail fiber domain-containing protein [Arcticibacterium luteifluviistationis]AWW00348.1 hypothetical protein DJ013_20085 [Arcticibacterium luteifluviistationis]